MEKKIEMLMEVLKDLTLSQWNQIKNEIDIAYRNVEYKKVPNDELGTVKESLIHKFEI